MKLHCSCGQVIGVEDSSLNVGSPTWLRHVREFHPDVWARIEAIESRNHPATWKERLASQVDQ